MANLTIILPHTHEEIPVFDVDFSQVTNTDLINELIKSGLIEAPAPFSGSTYELVVPGFGIALGLETKTLEELGVKDGEKIKLLCSSQSAAELTIVLPNTLEEIILSEIDLNTVTSDDLIHQLIEAEILPYEKLEYGYPQYRIFNKQVCEIIDDISLAEAGVREGDSLRILAPGYVC